MDATNVKMIVEPDTLGRLVGYGERVGSAQEQNQQARYEFTDRGMPAIQRIFVKDDGNLDRYASSSLA